LIKLIWEQQSILWKAFQQPDTGTTTTTPAATDRIAEYQLEIRHLYTLRPLVLPHHRDEYFPHRLSDFLHRSTPTQLRNYIINYKPAISRSVRLAKRRSINSNPIFNFPGFERQRERLRPAPNPIPVPACNSSTTTTSLSDTSSRTPSDPIEQPLRGQYQDSATWGLSSYVQATITRYIRSALPTSIITPTTVRREKPPHKHSRWKNFLAAQTAFRNFFNLSPTSQPPSL
jgi:hypothetical protein